MPIDRKEVESHLAEQERLAKEEEKRFLVSVEPLKEKILQTLREDPEHLYSDYELAQLFWTIPPPVQPLPGETREAYQTRIMAMPPPEPKDADHPLLTQEDIERFQTALSMLVESKQITAYPTGPNSAHFGITRETKSDATT